MAQAHSPRRSLRLLVAAFAAAALMTAVSAGPAFARYCAPHDPAGQTFSISLKLGGKGGKYVSTERNYGRSRTTAFERDMLRARAGSVGSWERYKVRCLGNRWFALLASNGKWVSAEVNYGRYHGGSYRGMLRARHDRIGPWEKFRYDSYEYRAGANMMAAPFLIWSKGIGDYVLGEFAYSGGDAGMVRARWQGSTPDSWLDFQACLTSGYCPSRDPQSYRR